MGKTAQVVAKTRGKGVKQLGSLADNETTSISTHPTDNKRFHCLICKNEGKSSDDYDLHKTKAYTHMLGHGYEPDDLKTWILVKDATKIKNGTLHLMQLEDLMGDQLQQVQQPTIPQPAIASANPTSSPSPLTGTMQNQLQQALQPTPSQPTTALATAQSSSSSTPSGAVQLQQTTGNNCSDNELGIGLIQIVSFITLNFDNAPAKLAAQILTREAAALMGQSQESTPALPQSQLDTLIASVDELKGSVKVDKKAWLATLPSLEIAQQYKDHPGPPAKGEIVNGIRCTKAIWPKELKKDAVHLPEFHNWLKDEQNKGASDLDTHYQNVSRTLGALTITSAPDGFSDITSAAALVAFYQSELHRTWLGLRLVRSKYTWSGKIMGSLATYADYHLGCINKLKLAGEDGPWEQYTTALEAFKSAMYGGHWQRFQEAAQQRHNEKLEADLEKLKSFPPVEIQLTGTKNSFLIMQCISKSWPADGDCLPNSIHALANQCAIGPQYNISFGGRKYEYEIATRTQVMDALNSGKGFLKCAIHKTWKAYGDIAKLLPNGQCKNWLTYDGLPIARGNKPDTFIVPVKEGAATASIPTALKYWAKLHIGTGFTHPTVNLYRKHAHRTLRKLTKDTEAYQQLMTAIDKNSKTVQDKHYILKEPEEDVALAKALCEVMYQGKTVAWPNDRDLELALAEDNKIGKLLRYILEKNVDGVRGLLGDAEDDNDADAEDDGGDTEDMGWIDGGHFFGLKEGTLPLPDLPTETAIPIQDLSTSSPASKKRKLNLLSDLMNLGKDELSTLFNSYNPTHEGRQRQGVSPEATEFFQNNLEEWLQNRTAEQLEEGVYPDGKWAKCLRVEGIDRGLLTVDHSWDVYKSKVQTAKRAKKDIKKE